jgi:hypothetical protein
MDPISHSATRLFAELFYHHSLLIKHLHERTEATKSRAQQLRDQLRALEAKSNELLASHAAQATAIDRHRAAIRGLEEEFVRRRRASAFVTHHPMHSKGPIARPLTPYPFEPSYSPAEWASNQLSSSDSSVAMAYDSRKRGAAENADEGGPYKKRCHESSTSHCSLPPSDIAQYLGEALGGEEVTDQA